MPSTFAGAVIFEAPVAIGLPTRGAAHTRAEAAVAAGKSGKAMQIFVPDVVGELASSAWLLRLLMAVIPKLPRSPAMVENRISVSVRVPGWNTAALVKAVTSFVTSGRARSGWSGRPASRSRRWPGT